ncbi:MAG: hypothetical protein JWP02_1868, partial [Acidimicrobiales bacterium]|nr:hypothetical protein [Acidimicrobiales bacterium]
MARLKGFGIDIDVPPGWDGHVFRRTPHAGTPHRVWPTAHIGNFPLPPERGDFGSGAVEQMGPDHVLVMLVEYDPSSSGMALFKEQGLPIPLDANSFMPEMLQRRLPGQAGLQRFFSVGGRAYSLYVVIGSHVDRARLVAAANAVLRTV